MTDTYYETRARQHKVLSTIDAIEADIRAHNNTNNFVLTQFAELVNVLTDPDPAIVDRFYATWFHRTGMTFSPTSRRMLTQAANNRVELLTETIDTAALFEGLT